jgi:hypothetical protein
MAMVLDPVLVSDPLELLMLLVGNMGPVAPLLEEVVAVAAVADLGSKSYGAKFYTDMYMIN